jgi:hypothetical protein
LLRRLRSNRTPAAARSCAASGEADLRATGRRTQAPAACRGSRDPAGPAWRSVRRPGAEIAPCPWWPPERLRARAARSARSRVSSGAPAGSTRPRPPVKSRDRSTSRHLRGRASAGGPRGRGGAAA